MDVINYNEAIEFILSTGKFGSVLGLKTITTLMDYLGNPQNSLKFIHVAGTNGKGSTSAYLNSILSSAGYKVGLFTSPSLFSYNERAQINSENISDDNLTAYINLIAEKCKQMVEDGHAHPTEFEIFTAVALSYFKDMACDIVILEVGLGGSYDSTNVIPAPTVAVITKIAFDHTEYLGTTLDEITANKAGIIKNGCDVVLYSQEDEVLNRVSLRAKEVDANLHISSFDECIIHSNSLNGQCFSYKEYKDLTISLLGEHQVKNAITAINTTELLIKKHNLSISDKDIYDGLKSAKWPARMEIVNHQPIVMIDGAHNLNGVEALTKGLATLLNNKKITFVVGILADKEYPKMIEMISPLAKNFITVTPDNPRALSAKELADYISNNTDVKVNAADSVPNALEYAISTAEKDDAICAFGSLYYLADVRAYFNLL